MAQPARRTKAGPGRSRPATRAIRRQQIIGATIDSIAKRGFAETTLASVAKEAGVSQGILIFHFKSKDGLLVETLKTLDAEYRYNWQRVLETADGDPVLGVAALASADFLPPVCTQKKVAVWHAFYGEAKARPAFLKICGERTVERSVAMATLCCAALETHPNPKSDGHSVAMQLDAMADGLWLRLLTHPEHFDRKRALRIVHEQLLWYFPHRVETLRQSANRFLSGRAL